MTTDDQLSEAIKALVDAWDSGLINPDDPWGRTGGNFITDVEHAHKEWKRTRDIAEMGNVHLRENREVQALIFAGSEMKTSIKRFVSSFGELATMGAPERGRMLNSSGRREFRAKRDGMVRAMEAWCNLEPSGPCDHCEHGECGRCARDGEPCSHKHVESTDAA